MAASGVELRLLNEATAPDMSVPGPIMNAWGVSYHPFGTILDKTGALSFQMGLTEIRDLQVKPGKGVQVWNTDTGEDNVFLITERSIRPNKDALTATITAAEVSQELLWAVVPGLALQAGQPLGTGLSQIMQNANPDDPPLAWGIQNFVTDLPGLAWSVRGSAIVTCLGKLGKIYDAHWRTHPSQRRIIQFARFAQDTGIKLQRWGTDAGRVTSEAGTRQILDYEPGEDAIGIVNDLTPSASGNATTAITLEPLFGRTDYVGYDPAYPVKRRLRQDSPPNVLPGFVGTEWWDYYIDDPKSIFGNPTAGTPKWRRRMAYMAVSDVTPAGTTPADLELAAIGLYRVAIQSLKYHAQPTNTLRVTTEHHGDIRGIAGNLVTVDIQEADALGNVTLAINQKYYVMEAKPTQDDEGWKVEWILSTSALWEENLNTQIIGGLEAIKYFQVYASLFPSESNIWAENDFNEANPMVINIRKNRRAVRTVEALFHVTLRPVRSTAKAAASGPHVHTVPIPALAVAIPALSVTIPGLTVPIPSLGVSIPSLSVGVPAQSVPIPAQPVPVSGGAHDTSHSAGTHSHAVIGTKPFIDLKAVGALVRANVGKNGESVLTDIAATSATAEHTHGQTAAAAYSAAPSNGTYGGFSIGTGTSGTGSATGGTLAISVPSGTTSTASATTSTANATTTAATASTTVATASTSQGGEHGHDIDYDIYVGPNMPVGVVAKLDGATVYGPTNETSFDLPELSALLDAQSDHTLTISGTLGRAQVEGVITRHVSTMAGQAA